MSASNRSYEQKAEQLHELRGWMLCEENRARDSDTSWFIETRSVLDEVIQELEHNAAVKGK